MNLSTWSIRHPVPPVAAFLVLCVVGAVAFRGLPITRFPNIDVPIITVAVAQPGAAPSEVVSQITRPVENAVSSVTGVKHITSTASESLSSSTIEFELGTDTDRAVNDVKDAVARARDQLPDGVDEPVVQRLDVSGGAIMTWAVTDPTRSIEALSWFVDDVLVRRLQGVNGVGKVERLGGADREIKAELDPDRLLAFGITANEVGTQLRATNVDLGGGRGDLGGQEYSIRALGSALSVDALASTPLALPNGQSIRLEDLGRVVDGPAETRSYAMLDGEPVISIGIFRATGASDVVAAEGIEREIERLATEYPDVDLVNIDDTTVYTEGSYAASMDTLYEGALLAIVVVFVFLRDWRATVITALALPLSIIPTFFVMRYLGFSLNTISLLGITLVTGILVDDAIVEIENIVRHIHMGRPAYLASAEAASEIGLTVIAISFTIVAVFAPVSFMGGIAGQYFKQFGLTVAIAVLFSLLVARLITPMLAAFFLRDLPRRTRQDGRLTSAYLRVLRWTLAHRAVTLLLGLVLFAGSLFSATLLPKDFVPAADEGRSQISLELPPGATVEDNRALARLVSERARRLPEVERVFVDGATGDDPTAANVIVSYVPRADRERDAFALEDELRVLLADVPDVKLDVLGPEGQRDVSVIVLGDSPEEVARAADALAADMSTLPQIRDVDASASRTRPEIRVTPKPELAASLGVTASSLAQTIRVATIGDVDANLAKFDAGSRQIPIVVRLREDVRHDLSRMAGTRVASATGGDVPLGIVADIGFSEGPGTIERYDRQTRTRVEADLVDGEVLGPALEAIYATPTAKAMPAGTRIERSGDAEIMNEVFTSFGLAMGAGILLVYVVLVILFDSFVTPVTILLSLPLAVGGAILGLFLFGKAISLPVVIGFLMLMGIVTKNAIMLVEFALEAMRRGVDVHEAMVDAGHKRARPITMTTIAMAAGMLPSALAIGTGGEFRSPMAIAVIGGLLVSTMLSLLFVPSLFSVVDGLGRRARLTLVHALGVNEPVKAQA